MIEQARDFLDDLWFDLRERRLLLPVIALAAALVVVPVLIGGGEESVPSASSPAPDVIETQPAVAQSVDSGVRTGSSRLAGKKAKNPFRQQLQMTPDEAFDDSAGAIASAPADTDAAAQLQDQLSGVAGSDTPATSDQGDLPGSGATSPDKGGQVKTKTKTKTVTKTIVKVERQALRVRFGKRGARNRVKGVESLDALPRSGDPVVILLGVDRRAERATFDVASRVTSVWGEGKCAPSKDDCDYLSLKIGQTAKFRYQPRVKEGAEAPDPIVYSLTLVRVSTKHVDR